MSTSLGLTVRAPGTSAMSSNPYATLALRPRPTHIPMAWLLLLWGPRNGPHTPTARHAPGGAARVCGPFYPQIWGWLPRDPLDLAQYTDRAGRCQRSQASRRMRPFPEQAKAL